MIRFNKIDEFIEEMRKEEVADNIVRLTTMRESKPPTPITRLSIVGTAKVRDEIVRLDRHCGDLWGIDTVDDKVKAKADEMMEVLRGILEEQGFEIRAGIFE